MGMEGVRVKLQGVESSLRNPEGQRGTCHRWGCLCMDAEPPELGQREGITCRKE